MKRVTKEYILFAAMLFVPYLLYGFQYFPILDDYIQYWAYPAYGDLSHVYLTIGSLATRPLSALLDPLFWGQLWPCLSLALLLITAMHLFSFIFFQKTLLRYNIRVSSFFGIFCLMLPLGMEGRFWLSSATRLVTGMFFAALSLYFCSGFLEEKKSPGFFILFALFQLISCGFYEAVAVFSVSCSVLLFCISFYRKRKGIDFLVPATSVFNIAALFGYYKLFSGISSLGSRVTDASFAESVEKLPELFAQLGEIGALTFERTLLGSFWGVKLLCRSGLWGILLLVVIAAVAFCFCRLKNQRTAYTPAQIWVMEIVGVLLFLAPLMPNLPAPVIWLTNRSLFPSLIGVALMAEPLLSRVKGRLRKALLFVMAFICMTVTVNEYDVYKRVHEQDIRLMDAVIAQMSDEAKAGEQKVIVVLSEEVKTPQNAFYKDHVKSVFDSDWALTGGVRARMESLAPGLIVPVWEGELPQIEGAQIIELKVKEGS